MFGTGADPSNTIKEKDLIQVSDKTELTKIIKKVINDNPKPIKDYQQGKTSALQFLVGQIMQQSKGKANPQIAAKLLSKALRFLPKHIKVDKK